MNNEIKTAGSNLTEIAEYTETAAEEAADFAESEIVQRAALRGSDP